MPPGLNGAVTQFAGYRVHEALGVGSVSTVHRAAYVGEDGYEREVALRRMHPHLESNSDSMRQFLHAATVAQDLAHPSIVRTYDAGTSDGRAFAAMELIRGRTLAAIVQRSRGVGRMPHGVAAALVRDLCDAVGYAYARLALVHGGIGPGKVMVDTTGRLVLVGFGRRGTPTIAPEVYRGRAADARTDVFSIGVLAYELITRKSVVGGPGGYDAVSRVMRGELVPPRAFDPRCPEHIESVVMRALSPDPGHRYPSAVGMRDALDASALLYEPMASRTEVAEWMDWAFAPAGDRARAKTAPAQAVMPRADSGPVAEPPARMLVSALPTRTSGTAPGVPRRPSRVAPRGTEPPALQRRTPPAREKMAEPRVRARGTVPPVESDRPTERRRMSTTYIVINTPDGPKTKVLEDLPPREPGPRPKRS